MQTYCTPPTIHYDVTKYILTGKPFIHSHSPYTVCGHTPTNTATFTYSLSKQVNVAFCPPIPRGYCMLPSSPPVHSSLYLCPAPQQSGPCLLLLNTYHQTNALCSSWLTPTATPTATRRCTLTARAVFSTFFASSARASASSFLTRAMLSRDNTCQLQAAVTNP